MNNSQDYLVMQFDKSWLTDNFWKANSKILPQVFRLAKHNFSYTNNFNEGRKVVFCN